MKNVIKLGTTTTGATKGVKYLWLVKDLQIYRNYSKKECYCVMAFNGNGWWHMFNGTLKECRAFMKGNEIVNI